MSEAAEQMAVVRYCDIKRIPIFHIPNGGSRHPAEAANLKRQGVKPGVPDLCVPVPAGGYNSLYIEMKAPKGRVSDNQKEWISKLRSLGHAAFVCYGAEHAIALIESYLGGNVTRA